MPAKENSPPPPPPPPPLAAAGADTKPFSGAATGIELATGFFFLGCLLRDCRLAAVVAADAVLLGVGVTLPPRDGPDLQGKKCK